MGLNAVVGWPKEEWGIDPTTYAEMRPGAYDIHERIRDMNRNGDPRLDVLPVLRRVQRPASSRRPHGQGPGARHAPGLQRLAHRRVVRRRTRAGSSRWPSRRSGTRRRWPTRCAGSRRKGCRAITMPELPHIQGLPSYHDLDYWDPFFRRRAATKDVVMCLHIGQGFDAINSAPDAADRQPDHPRHPGVGARRPGPAVGAGAARATPTSRSPGRRPGSAGSRSISNRCDRHYTNQRWLGHDFGDKLPSDIFREHSLACYVTDPAALKIRHDIGIDIIAWECDYPHSDSIWPDAPESVLAELDDAGCPDEEIDKITWQNTCRFFGYDPFAHIRASDATVARCGRCPPTSTPPSAPSRSGEPSTRPRHA